MKELEKQTHSLQANAVNSKDCAYGMHFQFRFVFIMVKLIHILYGYFIDIGEIMQLPPSQWSCAGVYGHQIHKNCNIHVPTINLPRQNGAHISWHILFHFVTPINVYDKMYYFVI